MKNVIILLISLVSISITSCSQDSLKYDFSKIKSLAETKALIAKIQLENEDQEIDSTSTFQEITLKGMHYAGVPIKSALITDHYTLLTTDTINFSAKKLLEALEAEKGLTKVNDSYNDNIEFEWGEETENKKLKINLVNGKHLAAFGDKDNAELTIKFKQTYDIPLANIHKEIKTFESQPKYQLNIKSYGYAYEVSINDIIIAEASTGKELYLNYYLTKEASSIKIKTELELDKEKSDYNDAIRSVYISAEVIDKSTNKVLTTLEKGFIRGQKTNEFTINFNSILPYYPKAWTDGTDLREDKNLKEKVIALYDKVGKAILTKDEQTINDIFYQKDFEMQQVDFDTNYLTAKNEWESHLAIQHNSYKYTLANDFEIEFNAGGTLIYTYPKDKTDMLIFTGKEYNESLNFFLYQPTGSNELKIIR